MHWLDATTSTNDVAAHLAERGAAEGTVVVAESQTAGRGRLGRAWFSPPGAGLYVSIVLRPAGDLSAHRNPAVLLTLASGVAIAEGVRAATGLPAEIKWPNDVMIGKRKLAGVLAEATSQSGALQHVIVGFGINLQPAAYPPDVARRATSIEAEMGGRGADRAQLLVEILAAFAARYADLQAGMFDAILSAWRARAPLLRGALVEWETPHGLQRGRAEDIDATGALLVRPLGPPGGDGRFERLIAGEVRWT